MNDEKNRKKIEALKKEIAYHDYLYYVKNTPEILDFKYDMLIKELEELEKKFPQFITSDSPTQRVSGQAINQFKVISHRLPMLSLSNTYSIDEIKEFHNRVLKIIPEFELEYIAELKIDGVAVSLIYENGIFFQGITRGDGEKGDDVSANIRTIKSIPLKIFFDVPEILEVRGEVYLSKNAFHQINEERKKKFQDLFANPRNAAAGSLKLLDSSIFSKRHLDIFIHSSGFISKKIFKNQIEMFNSLEKMEFKINPHYKLCKNLKEVISFCQEWETKRDSLPYQIDGIVIKVNSFKAQNILGHTTKSPRWAIAFKFSEHQVITKLKDIIVQVGRTGILTPVAILEPIELDGSTINKSTLHNQNEIKRKDIRIGDFVIIAKAGDVIPKIVEVVKEKRNGLEKEFIFPDKCPICQSKTIQIKEEVGIRCDNINCPSQIQRKIEHFACRQAMNIENLGPAIINQLVKNNKIKDLADIYQLKKNDFICLERMGEKSAQNLIDAINKSKNNSLEQLIFGLGIRYVGIHIVHILTDNFFSLDEIANASKQEFERIKGLGETIVSSLVDFFNRKEVKNLIQKFKDYGINTKSEKKLETKKLLLSEKTFVFTGELKEFSRIKASQLVINLGGTVSSTVNKNTSFVVCGENPGSKYQKAKDLNIKIIEEDEFKKIINLDSIL